MPRRRFFVPPERIGSGVASLPPDQTHHLRDVLRLKNGDEVELFDGEGASYLGTVDIQGPETRIVGLKEVSPAHQTPTRVTLAPALFKAERFEWMLQKATELGVDEIVPLETRFSEVHIPAQKLDSRLERWRRIVQEASKQSRRTAVPRILRPVPFADFLSAEHPPAASRFLFDERAAVSWDSSLVPSLRVVLCTGPEGGWDEAEVASAASAGYWIYSLGPRTLRAETAAIAALAIVQFLMPKRNPDD